MNNNKLKIAVLSILLSFTSLNNSLAEEPTNPDEAFNKNIETRARTDSSNLHYYPKIEAGNANLFTGAATLKQNEIFARLDIISLINQGTINAQGALTTGGLASNIQPTIQIGWGVLDNWLFSASVPLKYYFSGNPSLSDPWLNLKYKIIDSPFMLSIQADGKLPLGNAASSPPFGSGYAEAGGMILATKSFDPIFIQLAGGYRYKFGYQSVVNNQVTNSKNSDQIDYLLNVGWNFESTGLMADVTAYGYYPVGSGTSSYNFLSIRPSVTYKMLNYDFNLAFDKPLFGRNIDYGFGINGGVSIKTAFEYPRVFNLMFSKKIDLPILEKKKDLSEVTKGKELFINNCSKCHALVDPDIKTNEEWEPVIDRYREQKILTKAEYSAIIEFLRFYKD